MSSRWPLVEFGEFTKLVKRPTEASGIVGSVGVKWYGEGVHVVEEKPLIEFQAERFDIYSDDLIYNDMWARKGSVAIVPEKYDGYVASAHFPTWELDKSRVYPQFLAWYFRTPQFWSMCENSSQGSTGRNAISKAGFRKLTVSLPPLDEQQRIVARIEALAAKVEQAQRLRQRSVGEIDRLMASEEMRLWPEESLKNAPILDEVTIHLERGRHSEQGDSNHFLIKTQHVQMGQYVKSEVTLAADIASKVKPEAVAKHMDVLIACSAAGCLGRVAQYMRDEIASTDTHVAIARANKDVILPEYLYAYLRGAQGQYQLRSRERGDWQREKVGFRLTELNLKDLKRVPVPLPSLAEQRRIVAYLDNLQAKVEAVKCHQAATAARLESLLPSLLDRAFRGEL